jgi:cyclic-di-AMP phosphodiesterase PgpH
MKRLFYLFSYRKLRSTRYLGRLGLVFAYLLLMTLIMPRSFRLSYRHEVGKPWQQKAMEAPFDFSIYKSKDSIAQEQARAAAQVLRIYVVDSAQMSLGRQQVMTRLDDLSRQASRLQRALAEGDSSLARQLGQGIEQAYGVDPRSFPGIRNDRWGQVLRGTAGELIDQVYRTGYMRDQPADSLGDFIALRTQLAEERYQAVGKLIVGREQLESYLQGKAQDLETEMAQMLRRQILLNLEPNLRFNAPLTQKVRRQQKDLVSPVKGKVQEGQQIIGKDEIVSREASEIIQSLVRELEQRYGDEHNFEIFLSQFIIILLITLLLLAFLSVNKPRIYFSNAKLSLILSTFLLASIAMVVATKLTDVAVRLSEIIGPNYNLSYIYLAPACIVPIFISNFFGHRTGFVANLLAALYGAVLIQQGLEFAFVQTIAGTVAVYSLRHLRKREVFFYTLIYIFFAYSIAYIAFNLYSKGSFSTINYNTLLLFGINVAITIIAYNLIYVFERIFGVTSDLTYIELLDTNHPLLKEMSRKAPGTFQHSLQVANIAEATINEIGGNALLIHVGALYHDVGKTQQAQYFIENNADREYNPHQEIGCEKSADIIISHVKKGVEQAQKYSLPREIIHFIETHHGTTRVEFFYRVHLEEKQYQAPEDEELFRYPGPLPFTKETAVLMIADSIEAASRSLKNPTPEKIRELVNNIIDGKIRDEQLVNSNLTFKDIAVIRKVIFKQLTNIYHGRIEYPKEQV